MSANGNANGTTTKEPNPLARTYHGKVKNDGGVGVDYFVDLRSDTVTRPSQAMKEQMFNALVGDDVMREDPTVKELEDRFAKKLGKEAAIFVTSGSMGNLIAALVHCGQRGAEAIVGDSAHMFLFEQGSMAQFGGIQANTIANESDGTYSIAEVIKNIRPDDVHYTKTSLICVENTHNMCGGRVLPQQWLDELTEVARKNGIPVHMDGARIFNASVASGIPADRIVRDCNSVSVCLSKGLGAPVGSVLVGSQQFITQARRMRKALGGGMRQAGIIAAAGIYCLDNMIDRLAVDHEHTKMLAKAIHSLNSSVVSVNLDIVESNILLLHVKGIPADNVCERFAKITDDEKKILGSAIKILSSPKSESHIRLVFHCDVLKVMAAKTVEKICYVIKELSGLAK